MDSPHCMLSWTRSRVLKYETVIRYKCHKIWRKLVGLVAVWVAPVVGIVAVNPSQSHLPTLDHSIACFIVSMLRSAWQSTICSCNLTELDLVRYVIAWIPYRTEFSNAMTIRCTVDCGFRSKILLCVFCAIRVDISVFRHAMAYCLPGNSD